MRNTGLARARRLADDLELLVARPPLDADAAERAYKEASARYEKLLQESISLSPRARGEVGLD